MSGPRFIGIRDVVDPYKGLQDSVSKVGDIYRQYNKDIQEADRIRNEEARQSEQLAMQRTAHEIAVGEHTEKERIRGVTRDFDPHTAIGSNYGISEKLTPELEKLNQQVWDHHNTKTFETEKEKEQARLGVEKNLSALRDGARDRDLAKSQYIDHLIKQGVPIERAVVLAEASTSRYSSSSEMYANLQAQAKATDARAMDVAKIRADFLSKALTAYKDRTTTGSTGGTNVIKENFDDVGIKLEDQKKAAENFRTIIGDGFNPDGIFGWTGDATTAVNSIVASVTELNNATAVHNKNVTLGKTKGELRKYIDFNDAVKWVGGTAERGGDIKFASPGELKVFIGDTAKRRDFSEVANKARELDAKIKAGGSITREDLDSIIPQGIQIPARDEAVLSTITASYARMFPGAFPKPTSVTTPIARPPNTTADGGAGTGTNSERGDRGTTPPLADGQLNIIGGTLDAQASEQSEQAKQPISRGVRLPFDAESQTSGEADINKAVTRLSEIQTILAGPDLGWGGKKKLREEAKIIRDSLTQLPVRDRVFEAIRGNADQAKEQAVEEKAKADQEQKRKESEEKEVKQIRERLAGNLSPTVERINKDRLQELLNGTERSAESKNTLENRLTPSNELSTREYMQKTFGPTSDPFIDSIMNLSNPPDTEDLSAPIIDDKVTLSSPVHPDTPVMKSNKALRESKTVLFGTNEGDPIKTVKGGRVRYVGPIRNRGQSIIIEHDDGTIATYSDWSEDVRVKKDERIKAGDVLMIASGARDKTMFSVYDKNVKAEDPLEWLKKNTASA